MELLKLPGCGSISRHEVHPFSNTRGYSCCAGNKLSAFKGVYRGATEMKGSSIQLNASFLCSGGAHT